MTRQEIIDYYNKLLEYRREHDMEFYQTAEGAFVKDTTTHVMESVVRELSNCNETTTVSWYSKKLYCDACQAQIVGIKHNYCATCGRRIV